LAENLSAVATRGCVVVIGLLGGLNATITMPVLLTKRARVIGTVLRARPLEEKAALAQIFARRVIPLFERNAVQPVIEDVMPMTEIARAHERMESNETFGKLVLAW
ncbi:MAG: zinc-binding dehydrogenase, partial [Myxococcota bacterium]